MFKQTIYSVKKVFTFFVVMATILWSVGLPYWPSIPQAQAASGYNIMYIDDGGATPDVFLNNANTAEAVVAKMTGGGQTVETAITIKDIPVSFLFSKTLKLGMTDLEVKYLQVVLNSDPDTKLTGEGIGSSGKETDYFGGKTKQAVIKFQEKYQEEILTPVGLTKGTGLVGPTTRAVLNFLLGK